MEVSITGRADKERRGTRYANRIRGRSWTAEPAEARRNVRIHAIMEPCARGDRIRMAARGIDRKYAGEYDDDDSAIDIKNGEI